MNAREAWVHYNIGDFRHRNHLTVQDRLIVWLPEHYRSYVDETYGQQCLGFTVEWQPQPFDGMMILPDMGEIVVHSTSAAVRIVRAAAVIVLALAGLLVVAFSFAVGILGGF